MLSNTIAPEKIKLANTWLHEAQNVVIVCHVGPDGDAIGSSLAMAHFVRILHCIPQVIVPNDFPNFLAWAPGANNILVYANGANECRTILRDADIIICLDFNIPSRTGDMKEALVDSPARKIMIDHHLYPDDFCDIVISHPPISSTCELVFRFIHQMGYFPQINHDIASCLYLGMMTDTGSFTYNSNNSEIYAIISMLMEKGIDKDEIYRRVNHTYSEERLRLMGILLSQMNVYPEHAALMTLSHAQQEIHKFKKGDSEGFVNLPLQILGMKMSCFLREDKDKSMIKVSLRSIGDFACNEIATKYFNGGGHKNASGGEFFGSMSDAIATYEKAIQDYKDSLMK
ncbi:MAG TPA: bifunctional oligoribonuclease/PAP phosphatase NrnA [Bacteroidaceae bacterium]|nr:bifunctional oligoribonuclease/PAP phosphatase NrnA [Bacteroidaceae bacterium]